MSRAVNASPALDRNHLARKVSEGGALSVRSNVRSVTLYLTVGLASFAADYLMYVVLLWTLPHVFPFETRILAVLANCVSRPCGGLVCFLLNKYWTFGNLGRAPTRVQFLRFWCIFGMSLGLTSALIWTFQTVTPLGPKVAKLGAEGVAISFNYLMMRFWAFR